MTPTRIIAALLFAAGSLSPAHALEIEGVSLADSLPSADGEQLRLKGAGVRSKFFVDVYVGALYLRKAALTTEQILTEDAPNRVLMHFLYDEVSAEKLVDAWKTGFSDNTDSVELARLRDRIQHFNGWFPDVVAGDVITLDYAPAQGTRVSVNGETKGTIPGSDFNRALLRIWLGEYPADSDLKRAMLGGD